MNYSKNKLSIALILFLISLSPAFGLESWATLSSFNSCDLEHAISTIGDTPTTLVIDCSDNLNRGVKVVVPSTIELHFIQGGMINGVAKSRTETLEINGPITYGIYQRFGRNLTVKFGRGHIKELIPNWWGFDVKNNATDNAFAFNACLKAAMQAKIDIYFPPGIYKSGPIEWIKTEGRNEHGITIHGMKSVNEIEGDAASYLDFSGLVKNEVAWHFGHTADSGQLIGLTIRDIGMLGSDVYGSKTSTIGLLIDGNDAIRNLELINVGVERFHTGIKVLGTAGNSWPVYTRNLHLKDNAIGYYSGSGNTVGTHDLLELSNNRIGLFIQGPTVCQTYNSMINQKNRYGVVIDTQLNGKPTNIRGLTFNSPYFERVEEAFRIGYKADDTPSGKGSVRNIVINGGQYEDLEGKKLFARSSIGERWSNNVFSAVDGINKYNSGAIHGIQGNPANSIILAPRVIPNVFEDISYYYNNDGHIRNDTARISILAINPGNTPKTINPILTKSLHKGDTLTRIQDLPKGRENTYYQLGANGSVLTIKHTAIIGRFVGAQAVIEANASKTDIRIAVTIKNGHLRLVFSNATSGTPVDLTSLVDTGNIKVSLLYYVQHHLDVKGS